MNASERIKELVEDVAEERTGRILEEIRKPENAALAFMQKICGSKLELMEQMRKDPWTTITAIVAYLEEKGV